MRKLAIVLYAILIVVVVASAVAIGSKNQSNQNSANVTIQITANGPWAGDYAYKNGDMHINGTGNANYNLGTNPGHLTISLQNNGTGTLTVQLLQGGNVVQTQSTSSQLGVINIDQNF